MAGKCGLEILPSLSRITEYLAQQCTAKQAIVIIREILQKIPAKLLQKRFQVKNLIIFKGFQYLYIYFDCVNIIFHFSVG